MARKPNSGRSRLGSIRERHPGVWEVCVSNGYREDGSKRTEYRTVYGTEQDAEAERARLAADMGRNRALGKRGTLEDFWPAFVRRCEAKGVTSATLSDYEKQWRLRIEPRFGGYRWSQLRFGEIQDWALGMTHSQAEHSVRTLRRMINVAVDYELIDRNPLDHRRIDYPLARKSQKDCNYVIWGVHHVAEAMRRLEGARIEPLWLVLVGGGLRPEEGLGLWWELLSFDEVLTMDGPGLMAHATITQTWTEEDGLHETKNGFSKRLAPIAEPFSSRLYELALEGPRVPLWPLYPGTARKEWPAMFEPGGPLNGMPYSRLKDMRSAHETIVQDAGTLDTVNARLHGRSNVQTGYRHYLRPSAALDRAAADMGRMVREAI